MRAFDDLVRSGKIQYASQVQDNLQAVDWTLTPAQLQTLNEVSKIDPGFPQSFYDKAMVQTFAHGGMRERIDV